MCAAVYVLSTVTGYVLTSALLLKCPSLLHRRKRETFLSRHISHRGGESVWHPFEFKCHVGFSVSYSLFLCHPPDEKRTGSH